MTSILNKFKSFAIVLIVFSFFMGVTLNGCTSDKKSQNTENVEEASETEEHPAASEEHPSDTEEHPSDSEEHPSGGEEHPSDSTQSEHPTE